VIKTTNRHIDCDNIKQQANALFYSHHNFTGNAEAILARAPSKWATGFRRVNIGKKPRSSESYIEQNDINGIDKSYA